MSTTAIVAGVGMIPFRKPGTGEPYPAMAAAAAGTGFDDLVWRILETSMGDPS